MAIEINEQRVKLELTPIERSKKKKKLKYISRNDLFEKNTNDDKKKTREKNA